MIEKTEIIKALDGMADIDVQVALLDADKKKKIDAIYTPEIRQAIADLEAEFSPLIKAASENRSKYDKTARDGCLEFKESITGKGFQVVFNKGKGSWDMEAVQKKIEESDILKTLFEDLYTIGKPYTSMKKVAQKEENV